MKLNLLPTYVSKGKQAFVAWVFFALIVLLSIGGTLGMMRISKEERDNAQTAAEALKSAAENAVKISVLADEIVQKSKGVILNADLAKKMQAHNAVYPDFYDKVLPYIPSYYRIVNVAVAPVSAEMASVTMTGVIQTQEQYRNLMLALNRIPQVVTVARSGYRITEQYVPRLTEADQAGRIIPRGDQNIPDDPLERLNYMMAKGGVSGYTGAGGFGSGQPGVRGAMPNWSLVSVTVMMPGALQTPNPKATLTGGAASAPAAPGGAGPMSTPPPGGSTPPPGGNTPPPAGKGSGKSGGPGDEDVAGS